MTYREVLTGSAALLNDQDGDVYTPAVQLAYLNIALSELQELFEQNDVPVTKETSAVITVPNGTTAIGFGTIPALPADLIDIQELWESQTGQSNFVRVNPKNYLPPPYSTQRSSFGIWAWVDQEIRVLAAIVDIDLKIDYIKYLFSLLTVGDIDNNLEVINSSTFLQYRTAGLCAEFIEENTSKANGLNTYSSMSLDRSLGISTKGRQSIVTRRRPFRSAYKASRRVV